MIENIVVYTAVFNDYDKVLNPVSPEPEIDYVCFTDTPEKVPSRWTVREISVNNKSPSEKNRNIKILPHKYLGEYDVSIYIDANILVMGDLLALVRECINKYDIVVPDHPDRDCLYEEANVCIDRGLVDEEETNLKIKKYQSDGFPKGYGLSDNCFIIRKHNKSGVVEVMETWWSEYISGPKRDQISFQYSVWKNNQKYLRLPSYIYDDSIHFKYYPHKRDMPIESLYGLALAWKWNRSAKIQNWLGGILLLIYLYINLFLIGANTIREDGVNEFMKKFWNKYTS